MGVHEYISILSELACFTLFLWVVLFFWNWLAVEITSNYLLNKQNELFDSALHGEIDFSDENYKFVYGFIGWQLDYIKHASLLSYVMTAFISRNNKPDTNFRSILKRVYEDKRVSNILIKSIEAGINVMFLKSPVSFICLLIFSVWSFISRNKKNNPLSKIEKKYCSVYADSERTA